MTVVWMRRRCCRRCCHRRRCRPARCKASAVSRLRRWNARRRGCALSPFNSGQARRLQAASRALRGGVYAQRTAHIAHSTAKVSTIVNAGARRCRSACGLRRSRSHDARLWCARCFSRIRTWLLCVFPTAKCALRALPCPALLIAGCVRGSAAAATLVCAPDGTAAAAGRAHGARGNSGGTHPPPNRRGACKEAMSKQPRGSMARGSEKKKGAMSRDCTDAAGTTAQRSAARSSQSNGTTASD